MSKPKIDKYPLLTKIIKAKNDVAKFLKSKQVASAVNEVKKVNPLRAITSPIQTAVQVRNSKPVSDLIYKKGIEPVGKAFTSNEKFGSSPVGQILQGNVKGAVKATAELPAYYNKMEAENKKLLNSPDPNVRSTARRKQVENNITAALNTLGGPTGTVKTKINKQLEPAVEALKGKLASADVYLVDEFLTWARTHGTKRSDKALEFIDPQTLKTVTAMSDNVFPRKNMDTWSTKKLADAWEYVFKRLSEKKGAAMGLSVSDVGENFAKGTPEVPLGMQSQAGYIAGQTAPPSTGQTPTLPSASSSFGDNIPPAEDPVKKIMAALKESPSIRGQQEKLYSAERSKRFGAVMGVRRNAKGEGGYFQELSKLKGELPKAEFESVRPKVTQQDVDTLFDRVRTDPKVDEWDRLSAFQGLSKILGKEGGTVPTRNEIKLLNDVFGKEFTDTIMNKRSNWEKALGAGGEALNLPRTLMSTMDFSAPLRQGVFLVGRPKQFVPAFVSMFKQWGSDKAYRAVQDSIRAKPSYPIMKRTRLALTDVSGLSDREEAFLSSWGEKIPVLKHFVKSSNRAYTGFLNKLRADVFDDLYSKGKTLGIDDPKFENDLANFINNATGRGGLGPFERSATVLNGAFFSPRLMASRLNMLNPATYVNMHPQVRKEALKSLFTFAGTGMTILGLAKASGAEVGTDPRSADFGKIKFGNTRYDIWGGFQQYIKLAAQLLTGQMVSTTTGNVTRLGDTEEYKPTTRLDILNRFVEGKSAPVASFVLDMLRGTNFMGEPLDFKNPNPINNPIGQRFLPMISQDLVDTYKEYGPKGLGVSLPGLFGIGSQTYGGTAQLDSPDQAAGQGPVVLYKYLKERMSKEEANKYVQKLELESPQKVTRLEKFKAIEEAGMGENEMRMVGSGIKDGERADLIAKELNKLPTKEQKNEYINRLYDLEIMDEDDKVYDQLAELRKQGKLKAPTKTTSPSQVQAPEEAEEIPEPKSMINAETAPISQSYGNWNPEVEIFSGGVNNGTDIGIDEGTELSLPEGVWEVEDAYDGEDMNSGYGKSIVVVNRKTGEKIRLSHLSDVLADKGELLRGGSTIAYSGNSGNTTGPHLDIEYHNEKGELADILRSKYAKNL